MGMDMYIFRAHSKKEIESPNFWDTIHSDTYEEEEEEEVMRSAEVYYARKFYDLHQHVVNTCFKGEYECGEYVKLEREHVEKILDFVAHHPDYWGDFTTVPNLCRILYEWDEMERQGFSLYYECDW